MKNGYILNSSLLVILWFILMLMNINTKFKPKRKSQQLHNKDFPVLDQRLLMSNTNIEANESSTSFVNCIKEANILIVIKSKPNNFNKRKFIRYKII